jgi:predicted DNA-binding transcriptional regulator YafY
VAIALRTATSSTTTDVAETALRALGKLGQLLPSRLRHRLEPFAAIVSAPVSGPTVDPSTLAEIAAAIRDRHQLRFGYHSFDGTESRREIEPYRLIHRGARWYLLGWDLARQDWRTFRGDRISADRSIGPRFVPRPLPAADLPGYIAARVGSGSFRHTAVLTMYGSAAEVVAEIPPALGRVEAIDAETCRLSIASDDLTHLAVWIAAFGFEFEIHEPAELIDHTAELAGRLARAAARSAQSTA